MKVLEVCQEFPNRYYPQLGTFIKQSIDSIANQGVDVTVISPKPFVLPFSSFPYHNFFKLPRIEHTEKYDLHYPRYIYAVPKKYFYPITGISYSLFVSKYAVKNIKPIPALIHAHFSYPDGYGMMKLAKRWNIPLVISALGTIERKVAYEGSYTSKQIIEAMSFADRILSVSEDLKLHIVNLGIDKNKVHVVPNGVDIGKFKPAGKAHARSILNLPQDKNIVLFVGALRKIKGVDYLIEAAHSFVDKDTYLFMVGRDDGLKKNLEKRAYELKIANYIKFTGPVNHEDIPLWISASDILVLPSLSEGRPNVILEALACEVPVVATDVGGIPELMVDGETGYLVPPKSPDELSRKINKLLDDKNRREKMGKFGRKCIIQRGLTWEAHAKTTVDIYQELLTKS
ncbi:Glycosyltransferase involved in cell wall bisynthesis [Methanosarcina thermophila]|uniref:Glycosyltransferase involved in cell wall bisynthesis n=2 Tax=Methanosarcina thermophila TaxID=2210 RepID=A0A1I6X241_METTE|nr:glycosyltransferase [Methanosarcina thermophila]AKB13452.1 Glycosyltransferase [Methanosarcina thermophila TM-1]SFT32378.1 Glycosyltransferase involved in cell wall bisynthesis [Methanosarcina thermophila]HOA67627.1 glycosyltransferase [Methanosarcina thermophila]HOQ64663.1 glycosyltransferase [Methanosarcina thermophila]HPT79895.1 glycosyltransferase [Methanosarcina thermophila]